MVKADISAGGDASVIKTWIQAASRRRSPGRDAKVIKNVAVHRWLGHQRDQKSGGASVIKTWIQAASRRRSPGRDASVNDKGRGRQCNHVGLI